MRESEESGGGKEDGAVCDTVATLKVTLDWG